MALDFAGAYSDLRSKVAERVARKSCEQMQIAQLDDYLLSQKMPSREVYSVEYV